MEMTMSVSTSTIKYKLLSLGATVLFSVLLILYRLRALETGKGEITCAVLTAIACLALLFLAICLGRKYAPALPHGLPSVTFGASVTAFLLLTTLIASVYFAYFAPIEDRITDLNSSISFLVKLFSILSAVYFLMTAASMSLPKKKALHLLLAMMPILFCALRILNDFIDNSTMPLADSGGYHILGMIATMLFFLCEAKFIIGNAKVVVYLAVGQIAVLLCAVYNIPLLLSCIRECASPTEALYALLSVGMIIYMVTRLLSLRAPEPKEEAPVEEPPRA